MRRRLEEMAALYVKITTGILFVAAIFISVFYGWEAELRVGILWQVLGLAAVCTLGSVVLPVGGGREVSKNAMLGRILAYYAYVNFVVLLCGFLFEWFSFGNLSQVFGMLAAIAFVYLTVAILSFWQGCREAGRMNQKLEGRERPSAQAK